MSSGGQISVTISLAQIDQFTGQITKASSELKKLGTDGTTLTGSLSKVESSLGSAGMKTQDLATKTGTLAQKTGELKPKAEGAATGAETLGNKAQKAGQDIQQMGNAADSGGSRLQNLGQRFKDSALAIAGFATSLFNTYLQYDSIKDQEMDLERRRARLDKQWKTYNKNITDLKTQLDAGKISQEKFNEQMAIYGDQAEILSIQEEQYTDAVEDHKNAWKSFAISIIPTVITGMASVQGLMGKMGGATKLASTGVTGLAGSGTSLLTKLTPIGIAIGAVSLVLYAIKNNLFGARDAINNFGIALGKAMPPLVPLLEGIKTFGIMLGILPKEFATIERDMTTGMYNIKDNSVPTWQEMGAAVLAFGQNLMTSLQQFGAWAGGIFNQLMTGDIAGAFGKVAEASKVAFANTLKFVQGDLLPAITSFITMFGTEIVPQLPALITTIIDGFGNAWTWTKEVIDKIWKAFQDEVVSWFDDEKDGFVEDIMKELLKAFGWKKEDIDKFMKDFSKHLQNWAKDPVAELGKVGEAIATNIVNAINFVAEPVLGYINEHVFPLLSEILNAVAKIDWADVGEAVGTGVVEAITWIGAAINAAMTGMWDKFVAKAETSLTSSKGDTYTKFGENVGAFILKLITVGKDALGEFATGFWEKVLDAIFGEGTFEMVVNAARLIQGKNPLQKTTTEFPLTKEGEVGGVKTIPTKQIQRGWEEVGWDKYLEGKIPPEVLGGMKYASDTFWGNWYGMEEYGNQLNKGITGAGQWLAELFGGKKSITPQLIPGGTITPSQMTDIISKNLFGGTTAKTTGGVGATTKTLDQMINAALVGYKPGGYPTVSSPKGMPLNIAQPEFQQLGGTKTQNAELNKYFDEIQQITQFAQVVSQKTTEISAYFVTMEQSIGLTLGRIAATLTTWTTTNLPLFAQSVLTETTNASVHWITHEQSIGGTLLRIGTALTDWTTASLGAFATAVLTELSKASVNYITHETSVKGTLLRIGTSLADFTTTYLTKLVSDVLANTSQASAHFVTMATSITGSLTTKIGQAFKDFTTSMETMVSDSLKQTSLTSANFVTMATSIDGSINKIMDNIDDLIEKLDDLIEKQKEADSGGDGGDGGGLKEGEESQLEWHQKGGRFVITRPIRIGNHVFGEAGKEEMIVRPMNSSSTVAMPSIRNVVNGGGMSSARNITINGNLNAILVLPNGRELARTSSPYTLEYIDAGH